MAGNTQRRGAKRKAGTKKGMVVGSGGQRRKSLEGKGPTPKAEQRPGHPSARRTGSARRAAPSGRTGGRGRQTERGRPGSAETVAGRNAVVEALRAQVPVKALRAERIDVDDRVREVMKIALDRRLPLLEAPRPELDRITGGAVHQGLALTVPPYEYAHPDDLVKAARDAGRSHWSWRSTASPIRGNLGAVVRSAAFGAHGVVVPERRSAGTPQVLGRPPPGQRARARRQGDEPRPPTAFVRRRRRHVRGRPRR